VFDLANSPVPKLSALVAEKEPERRSRFSVRRLRRLLEEDDSLTIEEAAMAGSCLAALGGPSHEEWYGMLRPGPRTPTTGSC
jgi:hypothetical protein